MVDVLVDPGDLVTQTEVARLLGVQKQLIARWLRRGDLVGITVGGVVFLRKSTLKQPERRQPGRRPRRCDES